ncbi:MAG TPA: hypothetical protein VFL61_02055 [Gaiellaceae bacterium]|nr:hypothetical protein [Gaiellaceae bacterium]
MSTALVRSRVEELLARGAEEGCLRLSDVRPPPGASVRPWNELGDFPHTTRADGRG